MSGFKRAVCGAVAVLALSPPAWAQDEGARPGTEAASDIIVSGVRQAYRGDFTVAEIPQAIATIDSETLQRNAIARLTDALDLNASVARQNGFGGLWDAFAVRGFAGDGNLPTGYLVNGFNGGRGFGGQRDIAGVERIEVLKGPAAALLGRGEPGGTVNLITRQADLAGTFGSASVQYGSFDRLRGEADANLLVTGGLAVRLIGYAEAGETFRDTVEQRRWGLLPSFGVALGGDTRLTYDLELSRVEVPFDRGIVVLDGNFDTVPRSRFLGEPGDGDTVARATGHQLRLQHDFAGDWSLLVGASLRDTRLTGFSSDAELVRSRQKVYANGRSLSRQHRYRDYRSEQMVVRSELTGEFALLGLRHRVLLGADHDEFENTQQALRFRPPAVAAQTTDRSGSIIDIFEPVYGAFALPEPTPLTNRLDVQRSTGLFVQDQISLTDSLQVRLGGRYDRYTLRTQNRITTMDSRSERERFSPQAGMVYRLGALSFYAAYGEGFRANIGTDVNGNIFAPEISISREIGVKLAPPGGWLQATLAAYQLDKSNVLATDTNNPGFSVAIGKARSRGVELDLDARLPGAFDLLVSYAYVDAVARSRVLDPDFLFQIEPGDRLINIPDHTLSVQMAKRFALAGRESLVGLGVQHVGERPGETGTDFTLPAHTLVRVFGQVGLTHQLELFGTIGNLFDTRWYANSYHPLWVQPGAPRTATFGLRAGF